MKAIMPTMPEILREAIIVAAGALIATVVIRYTLPESLQGYFSLTGSKTNV